MMKKLSLKSNAFDKGEVLTREQLKKVMGGDGSEPGSCTYTSGNASCTSTNGDCNYLYCVRKGDDDIVQGICCDGKQYTSSPSTHCDGGKLTCK